MKESPKFAISFKEIIPFDPAPIQTKHRYILSAGPEAKRPEILDQLVLLLEQTLVDRPLRQLLGWPAEYVVAVRGRATPEIILGIISTMWKTWFLKKYF